MLGCCISCRSTRAGTINQKFPTPTMSTSVILLPNVPVDCSKTIIWLTVIAYALCWFLQWKYQPGPVLLSAAVWASHSHSLSPQCSRRREKCILRSILWSLLKMQLREKDRFQSNYSCSNYRESQRCRQNLWWAIKKYDNSGSYFASCTSKYNLSCLTWHWGKNGLLPLM